MSRTKIEWTEATWQPVTGCTAVSDGCDHCYAKRIIETRLRGRHGYDAEDPFRPTARWDRLKQPFQWKKPRMIFVSSMGDLFHNTIPMDFLQEVFRTIEMNRQHIYQLLTKRPARMVAAMEIYKSSNRMDDEEFRLTFGNVWWGVSIEHWKYLSRLEFLRLIPTFCRFVSFEPLLSMMPSLDLRGIHWAILGCESGSDRRRCDQTWMVDLVNECHSQETAVFVKQIDLAGSVCRDFQQFPPALQFREYPEAVR